MAERRETRQPDRSRPLVSRAERWLPKGIHGRLFLLISLVLLPMLILQGWVDYRQHATRQRQALQTEMEVAEGVAANFGTYVEGVRRQLTGVGVAITTFSTYTREKAERLLTAMADQSTSLRSVSWVSPQGTILASNLPEGIGHDLSARPYFRQIAAGKSWMIGDITPRGAITNRETVAMGVGIRDGNDTLLGVVVASFEPTRLAEVAFSRQRYAGGMYVIFDREGQIVFHNPPVPLTWEQRAQGQTCPLLQAALSGETARGETISVTTGEDCFAAYVPIPAIGWVATAARPMRIALAPVYRGLVQDTTLSLIAVSLAFILAALLARTIASPLRHLERDARTIGEGKIKAAIDLRAPIEVKHLRSTLVQMTHDLVRRAEDLHQSESRYRKLFEANLAGVYITRLDGTILDFNDAMMTMLGYDSREEMFQHRSTDFYADPAYRDDLIRRLQIDGIVPGREAVLKRKDGTTIHAFGHALVLTDERTGEPYIQGTAIDITARKQAEDALRELTGSLETEVARRTRQIELRTRQLQRLAAELSDAQDKERRHLAEILHDDLQQTIAAAKFHVSLLSTRVKHDPSQHAIARQVDQLLNEAIQKSRNLSHEISPPLLYRGTLAEAIEWLAEQIEAKHGLAVHVDLRGEIGAPSDAVKTFLYKAAQELLFNVVKHAGVHEARVRLRRAGAFVCLSVSDRGRGFNPEEIENAAGLGLLNLRERSESLGGQIRVRSAEGHGSTFLIAVPEGENPETSKGRTGETATIPRS
jgi:PAS domain S-box-containing protein